MRKPNTQLRWFVIALCIFLSALGFHAKLCQYRQLTSTSLSVAASKFWHKDHKPHLHPESLWNLAAALPGVSAWEAPALQSEISAPEQSVAAPLHHSQFDPFAAFRSPPVL